MRRLSLPFAVLLSSSCGSGGGDASAYRGPQVYTAGNFRAENGRHVTSYWKNGARTDLDTGGSGFATSIAIVDQSPVVAGYHGGGSNSVPCYWSGTTRTDLPIPPSAVTAYALSVAALGKTLYLAGFYSDTAGAHPVLWTVADGQSVWTDLPIAGSSGVQATAVFAEADSTSTTVFVVASGAQPNYWRVVGSAAPEQVVLELGASSRAALNSIFVVGSTVYGAGSCSTNSDSPSLPDSLPCLWVGSTKVYLETTGFGTAAGVWVDQGTAYVVGEGPNGPAYWMSKAGRAPQQVDLAKAGTAAGIQVKDGTVYVVGSYYDSLRDAQVPCFWAGSDRYTLPSDTGYQNDGYAVAIAVQ